MEYSCGYFHFETVFFSAGISDPDVIIGALLHDTVEDTDCSFEEIEALFGASVTEIVRQVTDDKTLPKMERKRLQVVKAPSKTPQAKLVKLADKLHNLRDLTTCYCPIFEIAQSLILHNLSDGIIFEIA